jgi:hypothetical protein
MKPAPFERRRTQSIEEAAMPSAASKTACPGSGFVLRNPERINEDLRDAGAAETVGDIA